jgi:NTP pyrophosphatase (non-canonical NTP hydrolase)
MADCAVIDAVEARILAADARYGPFASTHEALGVAIEEWDELREAIRSNNLPRIESECVDLAAALIRLARTLRDNQQTRYRSIK